MIIENEVTNAKEILEKIKIENDYKIKVCVVCFLFDNEGNLILHRRGYLARDEVNKLEAIGGSVNGTDISFREALKRELIEEAGNSANIEIGSFIGGQLDTKYDKNSEEMINWVILAYKGLLVSGELINMEPERCMGFEKSSLDGFKREDLSDTCYNFIEELKKHK